ncbi:hypothetical protein GCM10027046_10020 [Uliginosibacterium flavum]|uniref:EAL domain-containing protein n=1 Tax=Uliginosibacterium flavum TaxID=1396831 RepID=A0ABV2TII0_9RHOO
MNSAAIRACVKGGFSWLCAVFRALPLGLIAWGLLFICMAPLGSGLFYLVREPVEREAQLQALDAIVALKAATMAARIERIRSDAESMMLYEGFIAHYSRYLEHGEAAERDVLMTRMAGLLRTYGYRGIALVRPDGSQSLRYGAALDMNRQHMPGLLADALQSRNPVHSDLYRDAEGRVRWDFVVPLLDAQHANAPVGALLLNLDVEETLYQGILQWPTSTATGELVLARRDGDSMLMLNPLKYDQDAALHLRVPLSEDRAVTQVVTKPGAQRFSGPDYRGAPVLAAMRGIVGTPWFLIVKIDEVEAMRDLRQQTKLILLTSLVGVVLLLALLVGIARQQRRLNALKQEAWQLSREQLLKDFYELPFVGMAIYDADDAVWARVNPCLRAMLAVSDSTRVPDIAEAVLPADRPVFREHLLSLLEGRERECVLPEIGLQGTQGQTRMTRISLRASVGEKGRVAHVLATVEDLSEQLRDARLLRESETRLQAIFDHAGAGIGVLDSHGRWLRVNHRLCLITGYSAEELLGMSYLGITHPEDAESNREWTDEVWRTRSSQIFEKRYLRKDGVTVWVEVSLACMGDNEAPVLLSVVIDITARKAAELAVMRQDQRLQRAEQVAGFGNWEVELGTDVIHASPGAAAIYGLEGDTWPYRMIRDARLPESHAVMDAAMHALIHEGKPYSVDFRIRRFSDGVLRDLHAIAEYDAAAQIVFGVVQDITERKLTERRMENLAQCDQLTGLPNRSSFAEHIDHALARQRRRSGRLAVLMLDLDRFKDVNDSFGHAAGDELLQLATQALRQEVRSEDVLARLGGDEFGILIEDANGIQAINRIAIALQKALRTPFMLSGGNAVEIGVSIGISLFPDHGSTTEELIQHADTALYQAKGEGRNAYRYYTEALTVAARQRLALESRLHRALAHGDELKVYYQPQWDLQSGNLVGAEALMRWFDPDEGLISPAVFIPVAEESNLINLMTDWVIEHSCEFWVKNGLTGANGLHLAINLSPRSFSNATLAVGVQESLLRTGFPPHLLELELTEGALMQEGTGALAILQSLRDTGVRLALDDFGTGYSSLAYLRKFPLDVLKIDKSFVDVLNEESGAAMVTAIVDLAHVLGFRSLAEGVEEESQASFLRACGCEMYQGYLGSKPLPAAEFLVLVSKLKSEAKA